jgi:hypothetical protein
MQKLQELIRNSNEVQKELLRLVMSGNCPDIIGNTEENYIEAMEKCVLTMESCVVAIKRKMYEDMPIEAGNWTTSNPQRTRNLKCFRASKNCL